MFKGLKRILLISHNLSIYIKVIINVDLSIFVYFIILSIYACIEMDGGFLEVNEYLTVFELSIMLKGK
jgi:hypothetical protein